MHISFTKAAWGLNPANRETQEWLSALDTGKTFVAKVIEDTRSLEQNGLYWLWVTEIGQASGHGKSELHERFKKHYAMPIMVRDDPDMEPFLQRIQGLGTDAYDEFVKRYVSTTDLSVKQFAEMLDEIAMDARTRGIRITDPEEKRFAA